MADRPGTVIDDLAHLPQQIKTSVDRIAELEEQLRNERTRRNDLIGVAVDEAGMLPAEVGRLIGKTATQVNRILANLSS